MSDTQQQGGGQDAQQQGGGDAGGTARTFTQEQVNAFLAEEKRKVAARYEDYDALKDKAAQFDAAAESAKSAEQKSAERIAKIEADLVSERQYRARAEVAAEKGVPAEFITGSTVEQMVASADAHLSWRENAAKSDTLNQRGGFYSGTQTRNDGNQLTPKQQAAAALRELRRQ